MASVQQKKPYSPPRLILLATRSEGVCFGVELAERAGVVELELDPLTDEALDFSGGTVRFPLPTKGVPS